MQYPTMEQAEKILTAYSTTVRPIARELGLPQTAFDILLFLANNPSYHTARDIVNVRKIKANLVSINVDRLVREGYLIRRPVEGDRRKIGLYLTEKAAPAAAKGQAAQQAFFEALMEGIDEADRAAFHRTLSVIEGNIDRILENGRSSR